MSRSIGIFPAGDGDSGWGILLVPMIHDFSGFINCIRMGPDISKSLLSILWSSP